MIYAIFIFSLIFIAVGFIVTEKNAKYILSGYNTMSDEERQNIDIKSYIPFFRKFHIFLGISTLVISLVLLYFFNPDWSGIFMGTYPFIAYMFFIWKGRKFSKEQTKKEKRSMFIALAIFFIIFLLISFEFYKDYQDNQINIKGNYLEIAGSYGQDLNFTDIKSVDLIDTLPEIDSKTNGFAIETVKKGHFKTKNGEKVKLLINSEQHPIILLTTKDNSKLYYSSKDKSNNEIYYEIKAKLKK